MQEALQDAGYRIVCFEDGADLVIVNTCTVTGATDAQSRNLIRRARRQNAECRVIVTGCYAQVDPQALRDLPGVSLVIGNEEKQRLLDFLQRDCQSNLVEVSDIRQAESVCFPPLTSFAGRSRAFVQIQNGCDAFCSYCIIPYARGASRSAQENQILEQINGLVESGFREVVLTGIHIGGYGSDLAPASTLNALIRRIESESAIHRLRLGSIEPTELTDELLETMTASRIVCPHLHVPLQAGNDTVLQRMGRTYNRGFFSRVIEKARAALPDAAICLDVITGFPGETEQEFADAYDFIAGLPVTDLHVFPYSRRPGTPAAAMRSQVPGQISKARAGKLRTLAERKHERFAEGFIGQALEVVVETGISKGLMKGVSRNYLDLRFPGDQSLIGQCVMVEAVALGEQALLAEMVQRNKVLQE
jgi:threonylcarbamoyladenosine tRNA methylthiotransferase MtaB